MTAPWPVEMRAEQLVLELREILVRFDENLAAHTLMQECVPYFLDDASHPAIARARADQAAMVDHIVGQSYAAYYENNHHEKAFEEQYGVAVEDAHNYLHRLRYLRAWAEAQRPQPPISAALWQEPPPRVTIADLACNDGWVGKNLEGLIRSYHGIDLNPHNIERALTRDIRGGAFTIGYAEQAPDLLAAMRPKAGYDAVVCYELVEHVKDPDAVVAAMVKVCKPGGSLFVSTPLGACTGGDLPQWWLVEPKGHVRAFTPQTFGALLQRHGELEEIQVSNAGQGQLMVARVTTPAIVVGNASEPVSADRARDQGDPRPARRPRAAQH